MRRDKRASQTVALCALLLASSLTNHAAGFAVAQRRAASGHLIARVTAGATSQTFSVTTQSVAAGTCVAIPAAYGGVTRTAALTVTPAAALPSGLTATASSSSRVEPEVGRQLEQRKRLPHRAL